MAYAIFCLTHPSVAAGMLSLLARSIFCVEDRAVARGQKRGNRENGEIEKQRIYHAKSATHFRHSTVVEWEKNYRRRRLSETRNQSRVEVARCNAYGLPCHPQSDGMDVGVSERKYRYPAG
ncbi:hypothetical protein I7I50_07849 [Histoplasma capsulatum G186AR]|uniref:Secreted protein n=1 Tax=Ajellomyces capsulatus TaxID=5037 RepID=A0A8H7YK20_AJECA|nr:hypothetical protein I7I52_08365 [Histoplasma capsulatum]QSS68438.1 hypothetical protein I7I50_07849 [Histoplasma capsulatum G186AR]